MDMVNSFAAWACLALTMGRLLSRQMNNEICKQSTRSKYGKCANGSTTEHTTLLSPAHL